MIDEFEITTLAFAMWGPLFVIFYFLKELYSVYNGPIKVSDASNGLLLALLLIGGEGENGVLFVDKK